MLILTESHFAFFALQAAHVYAGMSAEGNPAHIELDAQLILFNELFGWARIAFKALTDRSPPDIMYGPSPEGTNL